MKRLSPQSVINAVGQSGQTSDTSLTPQHGSTGVVGLTSQEEAKARAWLASKRPAQVDEAIRHSLTSQLGVSVSETREWRFPEGKPAYPVVTSAGLTGLSTDTQQAAIQKVFSAMTPIDKREAESLIVQMQAVLPRRNSSEETAEVAFDVYVHCLTQCPADVAHEVARDYVMSPPKDGQTWFPSPPELMGRIEVLASPRKALLSSLYAWREPTEAEVRAESLRQVYRQKQSVATELGLKAGPGPMQDDGPRGERLKAWNEAVEAATIAKQDWLEADKEARGL